jgi:hypothetical protein
LHHMHSLHLCTPWACTGTRGGSHFWSHFRTRNTGSFCQTHGPSLLCIMHFTLFAMSSPSTLLCTAHWTHCAYSWVVSVLIPVHGATRRPFAHMPHDSQPRACTQDMDTQKCICIIHRQQHPQLGAMPVISSHTNTLHARRLLVTCVPHTRTFDAPQQAPACCTFSAQTAAYAYYTLGARLISAGGGASRGHIMQHMPRAIAGWRGHRHRPYHLLFAAAHGIHLFTANAGLRPCSTEHDDVHSHCGSTTSLHVSGDAQQLLAEGICTMPTANATTRPHRMHAP